MPVSSELGAALKRWRVSAGLHQTEAATMAKVSQSTISASEGGTFSAGLLLRLIEVYKPPADEIAQAMQTAAGEAEPSAAEAP